ncbi:hypothetical protein ACP3P8_19175, partial [Pseudomonas aeruginosa]
MTAPSISPSCATIAPPASSRRASEGRCDRGCLRSHRHGIREEASIAGLTAQVTQKTGQIKSYNQDLAKLVVKGTEAQAKRHTQLGQAVQAIRGTIQAYGNQRRTFLALQDEVASTRATKAPELLRQAKERHQQSGLTLQQWDEFLLIYKGDVDKSLTGYVAWADKQIATLTGPSVPPGDPNTPLFPDTADLTTLTLNTLQAEMTRLEALVSADNLVRKQYSALSQRIAKENTALQTLQARLTDAQGASARRKDLQTERDATYGRIFQAIINEQTALADLYAPLMARLTASTGTLRKLGFSVRRVVDVGAWAAVAEEDLLDRRKAGPFQGRGALTSLAESALRPAGNRISGRRASGYDKLHLALYAGLDRPCALCAKSAGGVPKLAEAVRALALRHRPYLSPLRNRLRRHRYPK